MVRAELASLLRDPPTSAASGEDHGRRVDDVVPAARAPAGRRRLQLSQRRLRERLDVRSFCSVTQCGRDRMAGAVADLQQPLASGAAAARELIAAVVSAELDAELLEPMDGRRRL